MTAVVSLLSRAARELEERERWPSPPHDPRERLLAVTAAGWEVRLFGNREFSCFVTRGLWHMQLWHPAARVSVLTPSRLTDDRYEAATALRERAQAVSYPALRALVMRVTTVPLPPEAQVALLERCLVDDVIKVARDAPRVLQ